MPNAILDPTGLSERNDATSAFILAARPADLHGLKIGLLENGKQNARLLLEDVATVLRERYGAGEATLRRKENFAQPVAPELVDELSGESDVVVIGVGD
ncbi:MAG TPA: hypothetical protein VME22_24295 [Solirubrobacteraceae bacterium]|nr:hypothetical protein [Solirubrobacteraceae bacterium]